VGSSRKCGPQTDDSGGILGEHARHVELIFFVAVGLSVAALTPLALPLLDAWRDTVRSGSIAADRGEVLRPGASPEVEVERSVRDRLYGEPTEVTATPISRPTS
jgi:hypothetical protein